MPIGTWRSLVSRPALVLAVFVPLIYYGIQAAAAPSYPDFSVYTVTASELGSDRSPHAQWFNAGVMFQGSVTLLAAFPFFDRLRQRGVPFILALATIAALALNGIQCFWAGWFSLPDPRHGGHPIFVAGMLALPFLLAASMWKAASGPASRMYFLANLFALAAIAPFMSGAAGVDVSQYRGLLQRLFGLTIFVPIGVAAFELVRQPKQL